MNAKEARKIATSMPKKDNTLKPTREQKCSKQLQEVYHFIDIAANLRQLDTWINFILYDENVIILKEDGFRVLFEDGGTRIEW